MTLPTVSIPNIPLPFKIPEMMHPFFVHFSIALPAVVIILEIINLFYKRRTIGILSFVFMLLLSIVLFMAYLTGVTDAQIAKDTLNPQAKDILMAHKQLGIYIVYASTILVLFKLFSIVIRKTVMRVLFLLVLLVFIASTLTQGKKGGELVYKYGVNVKSSQVTKSEPTAIVQTVIKQTTTAPTAVESNKTSEAVKTELTEDVNSSGKPVY